MKNVRVEINGVNTSLLPVLKADEQMKILKEIKSGK